jgi:hypothetical protein
MRSLALRNLCALGLAAALSVLLPAAEAWRACRRPVSECCVWGKALFGEMMPTTKPLVRARLIEVG